MIAKTSPTAKVLVAAMTRVRADISFPRKKDSYVEHFCGGLKKHSAISRQNVSKNRFNSN